jgi:hypothetical protein
MKVQYESCIQDTSFEQARPKNDCLEVSGVDGVQDQCYLQEEVE